MEIKAFFTAGLVMAAAFGVLAADENAVLKQELSAPAPVAAAPVPQQLVAPVPVQAAPAQAPVYIIEKQPTTYIEDAPVRESKADQLRKAREEVERQTEEKIVEKLEADRVKSEQERAGKVMDAFDRVQPTPAPTAPPQAVVEAPPAPVAVVAPAAPVIEVKTEAPASKEDEPKDHTSVTADAGFISYPSADNVSSGFSGGVSVGRSFGKYLSADLSFLYSNLDVESIGGPIFDWLGNPYPLVTQVDQYNIGANLRYRLLGDMLVSPVAGGGMSYTIRNYDWDLGGYQSGGDTPTSWAVDLGLLIGLDVQMGTNFRVGVDYRYMFNVAYDVESRYERSSIFPGRLATQELEEIDYQIFTVRGVFLF